MAVVDTHTHVACADRTVHPLRPTTTGTVSEWWREGADIGDLLADMDATGVERAVVVQAVGAYGYDCSCAAASVARNPDRAALVIAVDMGADDPAAELRALVDAPPSGASIAGVRLFGVGSVDASWLTDGRGAAVWSVAAEHDLVVVPCVLADRFADVRALVESTPAARVAVDHCGFPDLCAGDVWANTALLAGLTQVHLKVTSYVLEAAEAIDGDAAPTVERLVDMVGADRLCWGSDHPQDRRHDYTGKVALAHRSTRTLDERSRAALLGATGERLFFD